MDFDKFVAEVRDAAGLDSRERAETTAKAVVRLLGERLTREEAADVAAQLPQELAAEIRTADNGEVEKFTFDDLLQRIQHDTGAPDRHQAELYARAVTGVLAETVSRGEVADLVSQLPKRVEDLFAPKDL
jgi:uncharacterized protein (DUF2267 family)